MKVFQFLVGQMANFTYIIVDEDTRIAAIIDPSWNLEKIFYNLKKNSWKLEYIINTHSHFDHVLGNEQVAAATGAKIIQHLTNKFQ
jgi:glyoxylase-like metal-dependent hydrolase (beta-lactamase superfamily II)